MLSHFTLEESSLGLLAEVSVGSVSDSHDAISPCPIQLIICSYVAVANIVDDQEVSRTSVFNMLCELNR